MNAKRKKLSVVCVSGWKHFLRIWFVKREAEEVDGRDDCLHEQNAPDHISHRKFVAIFGSRTSSLLKRPYVSYITPLIRLLSAQDARLTRSDIMIKIPTKRFSILFPPRNESLCLHIINESPFCQ